jgi:acyl dehydratase
VALSPAIVVEFANAAGDNNPIHHDPEFAATTRFGRPKGRVLVTDRL